VNEKKDLIEQILDRELAMFLAVPTEGPCGCKDSPESFRLGILSILVDEGHPIRKASYATASS
jgi:hypothetical protein